MPHGGFYLHFVPFLQAMMYVGNPIELSAAQVKLIQSMADAFSTAYSRYEELRIKNEKLKIEDEEVNDSLNDLTQNLEKINFHGKGLMRL